MLARADAAVMIRHDTMVHHVSTRGSRDTRDGARCLFDAAAR